MTLWPFSRIAQSTAGCGDIGVMSFENALTEALARSDWSTHSYPARSPMSLFAAELQPFGAVAAGRDATSEGYRDHATWSERRAADDEPAHTELRDAFDACSLIDPSLTPRELARMRRKLAWRIHPDRLPPELRKQGEERLKELNRAIDECLRGQAPTP